MNLTRLLTLLVATGTLLCTACQSSKIAYGNSYYFKATPRETTPRETTPHKVASRETPQASELYVSTAPVAVPSLAQRGVVQPVASPPLPSQVQTEESTLTRREARRERRAYRKAVRTQLKQWLEAAPLRAAPLEAASAKSGTQEVGAQEKQQIDGFTRVGIIVGAAGLVMLLVGLLAGGNAFLVALGGILLGVGVVFWLIDIL